MAASLSPFQLSFLASTLGTDSVDSSAAPAEALPMSARVEIARLQALPVLKLRKECKKKGLDHTGPKAGLLERLEAVVRASPSSHKGSASLVAGAAGSQPAQPEADAATKLFAALEDRGKRRRMAWWSCPLCDGETRYGTTTCATCGYVVTAEDNLASQVIQPILKDLQKRPPADPAAFSDRYLVEAVVRCLARNFDE
eukprot:g5286.t1